MTTKEISNQKFYCNICLSDFNVTAIAFINHLKEHTKCTTNSENQIQNATSQEQVKINKHSAEKEFKCNFCDKKLKTKLGIKRHIDLEHEHTGHTCQLCKKRFKHQSDLKRHMTTIHENVRPYKCEPCNREFSNSHNLKIHTDIKHKKLKPYQCDECEMKFFTKDSVRWESRGNDSYRLRDQR